MEKHVTMPNFRVINDTAVNVILYKLDAAESKH